MISKAIRVLLIEVDEDDYLLTSALFAEMNSAGGNYALDWVADYDAAVKAICQAEHDVFLIDYRMGPRDGLELLREARAKECLGPVIILTRQGERKIDVAAMEGGAADFLEKDRLTAALLERSIRYALQQKKYEDALRRSRNDLEKRVEKRTAELACANEALRTSEDRLRLATEAAALGTWDFNPVTGELVWSDRCKALFGLPPQAEITYETFLAGLHPDDRQPTQEVVARALDSTEKGACDIEYRTIGIQDGIQRWIRAKGQAFFQEDRAVRFVGIVQDITDSKRAEEDLRISEDRFRILSETVPGILFTAGPDGEGEYLNQTWYDFTGLLPETSLGQGWVQAIHPEDRERAFQAWKECVEKRIPLWECRMRFCSRYGSYRWFLVRARPIVDMSGKVEKWIGTVTDIDDSVKAQEALQEADRLKDEFLAMLAHELRNPLAPIQNSLSVIHLKKLTDTDLIKAVEVIDRQIRQMSRLVDDLLDVSRITRGTINLKMEPVPIATVVARAMETSQPLVEAHQHELEVSLPEEPVLVEGDTVRLSQVLVNLLNNAAKYTNKGGRIELNVQREGGEVILQVKDTGIGIRREMLGQVFDLFTQADRTLARTGGGLGIGLTLVRRLVAMHGGSVQAVSEGLGRGSEFVVRLPTLNVPAKADTPRPIKEKAAEEKTNGGIRRILVVDDNVDSAKSLAMLLELSGHEVHTAYDGPSALTLALACKPEIVLLDIGLPKMDGYQVARRIREEPALKNVFLVALTGYGQDEDRQRSQEAGFMAHMIKPVDLETLHELLGKLDHSTSDR